MYLHQGVIVQEIILRRDRHLQIDQEACLHREEIAQEVILHRDHLQADLEVCRHRDHLQVDQVDLPEVGLLEVAPQEEGTKKYTYN